MRVALLAAPQGGAVLAARGAVAELGIAVGESAIADVTVRHAARAVTAHATAVAAGGDGKL